MTDQPRNGLSVLLTTEGTYPYHKGGVSTWCHALTRQMPSVDFTLLAVVMHPYLDKAYELSSNIRGVITVPLWGTEDPAEYGWYQSASEFLRCRWQTTDEIVAQRFVPLYERFLRMATQDRPMPAVLGQVVVALHEHFLQFDYHRTMTSRAVWHAFLQVAAQAWQRAHPDAPAPAVGEFAEAWRLLGRFLTVLAAPIPKTDVTHSAAAAFCGLPCVIARIRRGTPYLLTEHGVYIREQYLNLGRSMTSMFVRWFLLSVIRAVTDLSYAFADQVSPVCRYNTRWERWRGVPANRIRVIYNGVDPSRFSPAPADAPPPERPLVVSVGLIFPLKGQLDLIEAAAIIRQRIPNLEVRLYGSASDATYYAECKARVERLGLQDTVVFAGTTKEPWEVYRRADVVAMASISEAFPYALIEAMLCGAAIVATNVGGVSEALGSAGTLVNARDPAGLADAIAHLLDSREERRRLGAEARDRALAQFTEDRFVAQYMETYETLTAPGRPSRTAVVTPLSAGRLLRPSAPA